MSVVRGMLRGKPTAQRLQETVVAEYTATLEQHHEVLLEAVHDAHRVVGLIADEGEPTDAEVHAEARDFLHPDLYERIVDATADGDSDTVSDSLDRLLGRLLASFHQEVLYAEALERGCRKLRVTQAAQVWDDESDQEALQGRAFCALRPFATAGAWGHVIEAVARDFGDDSPFVAALRRVHDQQGLPSLAES